MANFLSPTQHAKLAAMLDKSINIPLISNDREADIFLKVARVIDTQIESRLPDELLAGLNAPEIKVTDIIAKALKDNLVPLLGDVLSLPFLPGQIKMRLLELVVDYLVRAMASNTTLDDMLDDFLRTA